MNEYPFPIFVDSTALSTFRLCRRKWAWSVLRSLKPSTVNTDLNAGGAFAKGLEVARKAFYIERVSQERATQRGLLALINAYGDADPLTESGKKKSWDAVAGAFVYYTDQFPFATDAIQPYLAHDGASATIEFSFSLPLPIRHPTTGEPILFVGRFDMLGAFNGQAFCVDEKTTGKLDSHSETKWPLRGQFIGYCYAARELGYTVAGTIVRNIALYKEAYAIQQVPVYAPSWKVDEWLRDTLSTVTEMVAVWESNYYQKAWGDACTMYRGCDYLRLCDTPQPERWISPYYTVKPWNPIQVEET